MTGDARFYRKNAALSLKELAVIGQCTLSDSTDDEKIIDNVNSLDQAQDSEISFFDNPKYLVQLKTTCAGACILQGSFAQNAPKDTVCLLSPEPYGAYARIAQYFYPQSANNDSIHPTVEINATAIIGKNCLIGPYVIIEADVVIGDNTVVDAYCHIQAGCVVGKGCHFYSHTIISYSLIGDNVMIHSGARLGQTGFGFHMSKTGFTLVPQLGRVIIEDNVRIGANTTIDRGALNDTRVGQGTMIDNLVQIGHNVHIGKYCVIVAQTGIAGSTVIEDFCVLGGQVGIAGHLHIGQGTQIAAKAGITKDIPVRSKIGGHPALPLDQWQRLCVLQQRMLRAHYNKE